MNEFYVSIILLGILLIIFSFLWIIIDRKKSNNYEKKVDEKKQELMNILADAEEMIQELNKFSNYVVSQVDEKKEELSKTFNEYKKNLENFNTEVNRYHCEKSIMSAQQQKDFIKEDDLIIDVIDLEKEKAKDADLVEFELKNEERIISINSKHKEVLKMAKKGFNDTEIAKELRMGKGEVRLILGINKRAEEI